MKRFWKLKGAKLVASISVLGGLASLFTNAFPPSIQWFVIWFARVSLFLLTVYIIAFVIQDYNFRFISQLSQQIAEQLAAQLVPKLKDSFNEILSSFFGSEDIEEVAQRVIERLNISLPSDPDLPVISSEPTEVYEYYAKRYGVGYQSLNVECTIKEDGSARVRRKMEVKAYSRINELDNYMLIPETSPSGEARSIHPIEVKSLTKRRTATHEVQEEIPGRLSALVSITPPLLEQEMFEYEMTEDLARNLYAIGLTQNELMQRESEFDYFGWNINRPTHKFSLKIYFPEHAKPDWYRTIVHYASTSGFPSNRLQEKEQKRLPIPKIKGPEGNQYMLNLEIDFPMIGLIYTIRWKPILKMI